jgi:hypothetical protein
MIGGLMVEFRRLHDRCCTVGTKIINRYLTDTASLQIPALPASPLAQMHDLHRPPNAEPLQMKIKVMKMRHCKWGIHI